MSFRALFLFALVTFDGLSLFAQVPNKWINYSKDYIYYDIDFDGDDLWIATMGGLVKLNQPTGTTHVFTGSNSGITNSQINNVLVATNGDKWICTAYGGIVKYNNSVWENFYILPSGDTIAQTFDVDEDPSGNIWFSAYSGLTVGGLSGGNCIYKYDGASFQKFITPNQTYSEDLACDSLGNVWGTFNTKLYKFDGVNWQVYDSTNSSYNGKAYGLEIDHNNILWVVTMINNAYYLTRYDGTTFANTLLPVQTQRNISIDQNNQILVYGSGGINIFDGTAFTPVTGLPFNNVGAAARDDSGNIFAGFWTAADTMFYKFDAGSGQWIGYFTSNSYLRSNYGRNIFIDHLDNRWMVTTTGPGLTRFDGTTWTHFTAANSGLPTDNVDCVFEDSNDHLWIGLQGSGANAPLTKFDGTNWQYFPLPGLFPSGGGRVFDITEDNNGAIWVATADGIARYFQGNWTYYADASLPTTTNIVYHIKADNNNTIWAVPSQDGLLKFDGVSWTQFTTINSGLASNTVYDITFDDNNNAWISVYGAIIHKFDGTVWTNYPASVTGIYGFGAADLEYNSIDGSLWLSTIYEVIKYNGSSWQKFDLFNSGICSGIYKTIIDRYNNKWMVTEATGFVVFNENGINYETVLNTPKYRLRGKAYYDANVNGVYDGAGENLLSGRKLILLPDSAVIFTNSLGQYTYKRDPGNYTVTYLPDSLWTVTSSPSSYQVSVNSSHVDTLDFGAVYGGFENTAVISCTAMNDRCSVPGAHIITYRNEGTTILDGTIQYVTDTALSYISAVPAPDIINGDTLIWNYTALLHFEERQIVVQFMNPGAQPVADTLMCHVTIFENQNPIGSDTALMVIRCSYDPNDKQVFPAGIGPEHEVLPNTLLSYTIRFQNMGNDTAYFVMILDTLDSRLDFTTFELLASSHLMSMELSATGVLRFTFDNINLLWSSYNEPASHGFIKYRIRPKSTLILPSVIQNNAYIYFDFNPFVKTNTTLTTVVSAYTGTESLSDNNKTLQIYPNPSAGTFNVIVPENSEGELQVFDSCGRLTTSLLITAGTQRHLLHLFNKGFYLLRYQTSKGRVYFCKAGVW